MEKPKTIRSILEKTLKALEIDVPLKTYSIFGAWREIVGESLALHTKPCAIRNRILFIDVSHPTWMQQLQFLKPALLGKVNTYLGQPHIQDIRFRLGKINPPSSPPSKGRGWQEGTLDEETTKKIERLVQTIDDNEARRGLRDILIKGAKLEQYRKKFG